MFQLDQQGLGWLVASYGAGALVGSLCISLFGAQVRPARTMLFACACWYPCLLGLALPIGVPVATGLLLGAGLLQSLGMVSLSILLLRASDPQFRGRVIGVRMLAIYTLPLGLLATGALNRRIGFAALVLVFVALGLLTLAAMTWLWCNELLPRAALANARMD